MAGEAAQGGPGAANPAREAALAVARTLQEAGFIAYFAGGCVRDELLGLTPKDYDVATDARPQDVARLFPRARRVGEAFGVMLVHIRRIAVEVATFRVEWGYEDHRHPSHVEFSDARHDALRRDFTINGLFEDPLEADPAARVIDYVGGRADLEARLVRAIGDPRQRFAEDYLRLLRAVRFAVRPGFRLDDATATAARELAPHLGAISRERIGVEMQAILTVGRAGEGVGLLQTLGLDGPALDEPPYRGPCPTVEGLEVGATYPAALAAWMLDRYTWPGGQAPAPEGGIAALEAFLGKGLGRTVQRWRGALVLSNEDRDLLRASVELLPRVLSWERLSVAAKKRLVAASGWPQAWEVARAIADSAAGHPLGREGRAAAELVERDMADLIKEGLTPPPLVTGHDLIAQGRQPGPAFRRILDTAYDFQLEGILRSREQALYWLKEQS